MQATEQSTKIDCADISEGTLRSGPRNTYSVARPPIPSRPVRWLAQKKAEILTAVRRGTISLDQACAIYDLSIEEFMTWHIGEVLHGMAGLRATTAARKRHVNVADHESIGTLRSVSRVSPHENA